MIGEISAAIAAVQAINTAIAQIKEAGNNAQGLGIIIERFASANEKVQEAEAKHAGKMSVGESTQLQIAKRRMEAHAQALKDMLLMAGLASDYHEIMNRVEESRIRHEKQIRLIKKKQAERRKMLALAGTIFFGWVSLMGFIWFAIWFYQNL